MSPVEQSPSPGESTRDTRQNEVSKRMRGDLTEQASNSIASQATHDEEPLDLSVDMEDEQCMIEEATVLDARDIKTKEVTIEPPAVPERNSLRASKLLDSLKLNSIESATQSLNTTHDVYLSSEEDASTSADDFSDDDYDSVSEGSEEFSLRRKSQEDTARAVSVIFVGKPCIIDLTRGRRSRSPVRKRPQSNIFERSSMPSSTSPSLDTRSLGRHAPRNSSILSVSSDKSKGTPSFLGQDPFPASNYKLESQSKDQASSTPRTPRSSTALHRFQKSISLARKRSRPNLKATVSSDNLMQVAAPKNFRLSLNTSPPAAEELEPPARSEPPPAATTIAPQSPRTYNEILRAARKNAQPPPSPSTQATPPMSPPTTTTKRGLLSGLSINRRRSVRVRS